MSVHCDHIDSFDSRFYFLKMLNIYRLHADESRRRVVDELASLVRGDSKCFERRHEEGAKHIGTSVFLVRPQDHRILFMWHTLLQRWTQPGGHADGDVNIHRVALRELAEETGVVCDRLVSSTPFMIHRFDYPREVFGYTKSIFNLFFMAILPNGQEPRIMEPHACGELRWMSVEEATELLQNVPGDEPFGLYEALNKALVCMDFEKS